MRADFETIAVSRHGDHILLVTLNRPEVSNAMNTRMGLDLMELLETLSIDLEGLRAAIITGTGKKAFCAGGDLKERDGMSDESWRSQHAIFERMVRAIIGCPIPLLAAVNGGGRLRDRRGFGFRVCGHKCALCPDGGDAWNNAGSRGNPESC